MSVRRTTLAVATVGLSLLLIAPLPIVAQDGPDATPAAATPEPAEASPEPAEATTPPEVTPEPSAAPTAPASPEPAAATASPATSPEPSEGTPEPARATTPPARTPEPSPASDDPAAATDDPTVAPDPEVDPPTSVLPDLAPRSPTRTPVEICAAASGQLEDGRCLLHRAPLTDGPVTNILGDGLEAIVLEVGSRPTSGTGLPLLDASIAEQVAFVDRVEPSKRQRKAFERARKRKGVINGPKDSWNSVGIIEVPRPWGEDGGDAWLLRLASPGGTLDIGRVDGKDRVTDERGRKTAGLGFVGDELLTFVVPGGLDPRFMLDLAWVDPTGRTVVQHLGGPASSDALIPRSGSFEPVVDCGSYVAAIDFESSTDGQAYDLHQIDLVIDTNILPLGVDPSALRFDVTLSPSGSRARRADAIRLQDIEATRVRPAIAMTLDLRPEMLTGPTGYQLFEQPFAVETIEGSIDPSSLPFDPAEARALLEEAGWVDADGDGIHEASLDGLASELSRHTGFEHTADPLTWGDPACGRDSQYLAAADVCEVPLASLAAEAWQESFGEPVEELDLRRGFFPGDLFGCTVLGPDEQLVSIFATSPRFGVDEALAPDALAWTTQLECEVDEAALAGLPPVGAEAPVKVADCETADFSLWADRSFGGLSYVLLPGREQPTDIVVETLRTFDSTDLDGDGTPDRHDLDLDGDGTADLDDSDDDGDGVADWLDANERDARVTVSPARESTATALEDIIRGG